jgi:SOS response regulatory protein OraA/RecX
MVLKLEIKKEDPRVIQLSWEGKVWREVHKSLFFNDLNKFPEGLTWEEFLERFTSLEEKIARRYAIYMLSKRNFLASNLESKLLAKGVSPSVAQAIILYCSEKGYIDDSQEMARLIGKELRKGQSAKAVYFKLKQKRGVDDSQLRQLLRQAALSDQEALQRWFEKNGRKINRKDPKEMKKWIAKLCRLGFSAELVFHTLKSRGDI